MKLWLFAIRDAKTDQFGNPMVLQSRGQAVRSVQDEIQRKDPQNILASHPEDFELFELGSYNTDTGMFDTHVPKSVIVCSDLVHKSSQQ